MHAIHRWDVLRWPALCGLLCGLLACSSVPLQEPHDADLQRWFADALFKPPAEMPRASQVFELSPEMLSYASRRIEPLIKRSGQQRALIESLYERSALQINYDAEYTRNASEAFADRRGNCLSLVIMTAAFARHIGIPVHFRSVFTDEYLSRSNDLLFVSGHVNLSLQPLFMSRGDVSYEPSSWVIDFVQLPAGTRQRVVEIGESTIVSMYMNNKAAEALNAGEVDTAYWFARAAVMAEPRYTNAINTLGVIYRRHGDLQLAEQLLRHVLQREPDNIHAIGNLAVVLGEQHRLDEREALMRRLAQLQPVRPFQYLDDGIAAMRRGDARGARELFSKELARSSFSDETHFWLAQANYALHDRQGAAEQLLLAKETSPTQGKRQLYAAKLLSLQQDASR